MGIEYNSSAKHFQVPVMPKAIIHYESEHIRADKNRSDTIGLKLNEKVVSKIANYCIGWQKRYIHFLSPISAEWDQDQNFK